MRRAARRNSPLELQEPHDAVRSFRMLGGHASSNVAVQLEPEIAAANAEEEELLARCSRGERSAMRILYDRHARVVMSRARRLGLSADEAEDVAQEVFTAAFQNVSRIRAGALGAFLFRLTSNRVT